MLIQRGADLKRDAVKTQEATRSGSDKASPSSSGPRRKLNFKDKHALDTLPKTIKTLQDEIAKQQRHLDDTNLFAKDRKKFDRVSAALADAQKQLQDAEDRWLELEMLREEIENA
jgi:ATP-binding cassette subfamily F protein uup